MIYNFRNHEYRHIARAERQLVNAVTRLDPSTKSADDLARLSLLLAGVTFSINVIEYKLGVLEEQAAFLINDSNVVGATLVVRSMLEHHAIAVELGAKLTLLWERGKKAAPDDQAVAQVFADAEKQIARVLAATPGSQEAASPWRLTWEAEVRKPYHVLVPIRALDQKEQGFLKTYGLLSHVVHGTICTGGDLLRKGAYEQILSQLVLNLATLVGHDALMDRQAASMLMAFKLTQVQGAQQGTGTALKAMSIAAGQKLKMGRDVLGSGTRVDPYRFRRGLVYYEAYAHWLRQEGIAVRARWTDHLAGGPGDRVETEDGRTIYLLNDTLHFRSDSD